MARILLVDDDDTLRDTVRQMLEIDRHEVVDVADGAGALRLIGTRRFDLLITDILMPMMDGARLIKESRRLQPNLPILAISGGRRLITPAFNLETADLIGANGKLAKPFNHHALRDAVAESLANAHGAA